jgi:hypothetical protein
VKRSLLCAALLVAAVIALGDAAAIEIAIGDTKIELVAPTGYCPLDRKDWPDSQLLDFTADGIRKQGERLAYLVDCDRARSWHEGGSKGVSDIADYQASLQFGDQNVTSAMLQELCAAVRKHDDSTKGWFGIFVSSLKSAVRGKYGGAEDTMLAYIVLSYEKPACYLFSSSMLKNQEQVYTVSALTTIKSKLVTVHISRKFGSMDLIKGKTEDVIKRLVVASRETATALVAANQ